jgi:ABC-type lipoprotein export system ATPase subunit
VLNAGAGEGGNRTLVLPTLRREPVVTLRSVIKTYQSPAGPYTALNGVDLEILAGEFAAVIGKSGSGKSTLINMVTGIDRPTSGEVVVAGTPVHTLDEGATASWRGRSVGVVFQFFQLLPTLTLLENVMLPMDFCSVHEPSERAPRARALLDRVGLGTQADKMPSELSGGQQQRVAIARALANDPPLIVADEPTGNLDSKTADQIFDLFAELVAGGKTILMVTHDSDLARRATRTVVVADGTVVNQYVTTALAMLDVDQFGLATAHLEKIPYEAGEYIIREGEAADRFYVLVRGEVDVLLQHPGGQEILATRLRPGHYFGEIAFLTGGTRTASVRASPNGPVEVFALDGGTFDALVSQSEYVRTQFASVVEARTAQNRRTVAGSA